MKLQAKHLAAAAMLVASMSVTAENADSLAALADKAPANAALNLKTGRAYMESGNPARARTYLNKGGNDALAWLALAELEDYKFDRAAELAGKYLSSKHNTQGEGHVLAEDVARRAELAATMLDRVERVQIIDSIVVDRNGFFKAFNISPTTGYISDASVLKPGMKAASPTTVYVSESGERMMWGAPDDTGRTQIVEASHLADGSWETPQPVSGNLQLGGNANYPFLLADGMTLYYASDGEGTLGGYDIYITRNDGDRYLNPQNVGMPYNSPMDDYLLAIDDATGAGWWATDRNRIPDSLTVYVFVPQELRDNYSVDGTPDLIDRARITSIAATQKPGVDYSALRKAVRDVMRHARTGGGQSRFALSMPDGRVITSLEQFVEPEARDLMQDYLSEYAVFEERAARLREMRESYAGGDRSLAADITGEEAELEQLRDNLIHMRNDVVKAEMRD